MRKSLCSLVVRGGQWVTVLLALGGLAGVLSLVLSPAEGLSKGCSLPGSTRPVVKIGLVAPFEGLYRAVGYDALYAVKLAIRQRNGAGGVGGEYMVELVALNDDNDPAEAALQVREMAVDPAVMGVVGHFSAATTLAALESYHQAGLALVVPGDGGSTSQQLYPGIFWLGADDERLGREAARYTVGELGARNVAVVGGRDNLATAFSAAVAERGAVVMWEGGASQLASLVGAEPEAVFFSAEVGKAAQQMARLREMGVRATLVAAGNLGSPPASQIGGPVLEGTIYLSSVPALGELVGGESFTTAYSALADRPPGPYAVVAYDAANVLLDALEKDVTTGGHPTRGGVAAALAGLHREGLTGPIVFGAGGWRQQPPLHIFRVAEISSQ